MTYDLANHARRYAPEYGEYEFSDHLPMAVTALRELGADEEVVEAFAKRYVKQLRRKKIGAKSIDDVFLSARIGDASVYPLAFNYFLEAIERDGRADVLGRHLPELLGAIGAAAFHGLIRTAFGLIADEDAEIAAGLAYWWAHAATPSYSPSIGAANNDHETLLADIAAAFKSSRKKLRLEAPTISGRIREAAAQPRIGAVLSRAAAADVSFDDIAATALRIYLAERDFASLHCVTGAHAARVLGAHVVMDDAELRKALWASLCAVYASMGAPALQPLAPAPAGAPAWRVITSAAQSARDEHDIEFTYACVEEARCYGRDTQYRYAASRQLGI